MDDNTTATEAVTKSASKGPKRLNAKSVKRRLSKISTGAEPRVVRKKTGRLAVSILERIASGNVKNPKALAKAFVDGKAEVLQAAGVEPTEEAAVDSQAPA